MLNGHSLKKGINIQCISGMFALCLKGKKQNFHKQMQNKKCRLVSGYVCTHSFVYGHVRTHARTCELCGGQTRTRINACDDDETRVEPDSRVAEWITRMQETKLEFFVFRNMLKACRIRSLHIISWLWQESAED